jgi:hypothetical protein
MWMNSDNSPKMSYKVSICRVSWSLLFRRQQRHFQEHTSCVSSKFTRFPTPCQPWSRTIRFGFTHHSSYSTSANTSHNLDFFQRSNSAQILRQTSTGKLPNLSKTLLFHSNHRQRATRKAINLFAITARKCFNQSTPLGNRKRPIRSEPVKSVLQLRHINKTFDDCRKFENMGLGQYQTISSLFVTDCEDHIPIA